MLCPLAGKSQPIISSIANRLETFSLALARPLGNIPGRRPGLMFPPTKHPNSMANPPEKASREAQVAALHSHGECDLLLRISGARGSEVRALTTSPWDPAGLPKG